MSLGALYIFTQILDFISFDERQAKDKLKEDQWWYRIAWAFLRPIGIDGRVHADHKVRLQLYTPISVKVTSNTSHEQTTEVRRQCLGNIFFLLDEQGLKAVTELCRVSATSLTIPIFE